MDRIKKLKIKKQDGTFSDYIPIGADAENIDTTDGESVQFKLNKTPYYYNTIADMKADTKLKVGDMVITLGYYEANDGGKAEYKIINGSYTDDGGSYHELDNHLFAELITDNEVNIKQFGAYGDGIHEDTTYIQNCINFAHNNNINCILSEGTYNVMQIVLLDNTYIAKHCKIRQLANVSAIVNEKIDLFGGGATYSGINDIYTAKENGDTNKIIIKGDLEVINNEEEIQLTYQEQLQYHGFRWLSGVETIDYFPINFVGLSDSVIENIKIVFASENANINLGFSLNTVVKNCVLNNGVDNDLQFFASIQCEAIENSISNGGGGLLVMQNCEKCLFAKNMIYFTERITSVNDYMISIKKTKNSVISENTINGYGNIYSLGISISSQNGGCENIVISSNTISNCYCGIFLENSNSITVNNNNLYNCCNASSRGSINVNNCLKVNLISNIINTSNYHGICLMSGNDINIIDNLIQNINTNGSGILFLDTNTVTTNYLIKNNQFINDSGSPKCVWFATGSKILFRHYLIKDNVDNFNGRYKRDTLDVNTFLAYDRIIDFRLRLRRLGNNPTISSTWFTLTKNDTGNYKIEILPSETSLKMIIRSLMAYYHAGYSANDVHNNIIKCVYDDTKNAQNSTKNFSALLYDVTNSALSDNPTSNANAGTLLNFGLDFLVSFEIDYTNWN